jgi:hypothetical protein
VSTVPSAVCSRTPRPAGQSFWSHPSLLGTIYRTRRSRRSTARVGRISRSAHFPSISMRVPSGGAPARIQRRLTEIGKGPDDVPRHDHVVQLAFPTKVGTVADTEIDFKTRISRLQRARSIIRDERSTPVTIWPSSANLRARKPVPHPTSSTRLGAGPAKPDSRSSQAWCRSSLKSPCPAPSSTPRKQLASRGPVAGYDIGAGRCRAWPPLRAGDRAPPVARFLTQTSWRDDPSECE